MNAVLHAINWKALTDGELFLIACIAGSIFLVAAWFTDVLLEKLSFGVIGNTIILFIGAIIGLFILVHAGYPPTQRQFMHAIFACAFSAMVFLTLVAAMRRSY